MRRTSRRRLATIAISLLAATAMAGAQEGRFEEKIEVSRVLLDVRALDGRGDPIRGLEAGDFSVRVDHQPAKVDSVRWVSGTTPYSEGLAPQAAAAAGVPAAPAGRRLVLLFQKDMSSASYVTGFLRMEREAKELLDSLSPADRVAVLSFDSHLKLWVDFTEDRSRLRKAIDRSIIFEREPPALGDGGPDSLAASFDRAAARDAATPEAALLVIANALRTMGGTKSLAFFGAWMGHIEGSAVRMAPDYSEARRALLASRTTVFSLDLTDADGHTLEVGLQQVAEDTGGFYARTRHFPTLAMSRLERAIEGYYNLSFERPRFAQGSHTVAVELTRRKGTVLTSGRYVDP